MSDMVPDGVRFTCDWTDPPCRIEPHRAPAIFVPHAGLALAEGRSIATLEHAYRPLRMFTNLHFCDLHRVQISDRELAQKLLSPAIKVSFEDAARKKRALDFKPEFEMAYLEWVLVTTPEYRAFLESIGHRGILGAANLTKEQQLMKRAKEGLLKVAE